MFVGSVIVETGSTRRYPKNVTFSGTERRSLAATCEGGESDDEGQWNQEKEEKASHRMQI